MTTVAYRDGALAVDGLTSSNNAVVSYDSDKTLVIGERAFVVCGSLASARRYASLLAASSLVPQASVDDVEMPKLECEDDFTVVELLPSGVVRVYEPEAGAPYEMSHPMAWGSGQHFALGAMQFGATAVQAVQAASLIDPWTGGPVRVLKWVGGELSRTRL